jgi:hypothetical protein
MSDNGSTGILPVLPIHRLEACATTAVNNPGQTRHGACPTGPYARPIHCMVRPYTFHRAALSAACFLASRPASTTHTVLAVTPLH